MGHTLATKPAKPGSTGIRKMRDVTRTPLGADVVYIIVPVLLPRASWEVSRRRRGGLRPNRILLFSYEYGMQGFPPQAGLLPQPNPPPLPNPLHQSGPQPSKAPQFENAKAISALHSDKALMDRYKNSKSQEDGDFLKDKTLDDVEEGQAKESEDNVNVQMHYKGKNFEDAVKSIPPGVDPSDWRTMCEKWNTMEE
ncbi:hypothetical protein Taro_025027 [Colocasia esculenta]|uniref:Uncharacterized protein n=1 Tax=Colocasia esculenta TaxID=4460 RepID=A0A843V233_COLES|nr:hypothetical protein [Colocasia esculenta]